MNISIGQNTIYPIYNQYFRSEIFLFGQTMLLYQLCVYLLASDTCRVWTFFICWLNTSGLERVGAFLLRQPGNAPGRSYDEWEELPLKSSVCRGRIHYLSYGPSWQHKCVAETNNWQKSVNVHFIIRFESWKWNNFVGFVSVTWFSCWASAGMDCKHCPPGHFFIRAANDVQQVGKTEVLTNGAFPFKELCFLSFFFFFLLNKQLSCRTGMHSWHACAFLCLFTQNILSKMGLQNLNREKLTFQTFRKWEVTSFVQWDDYWDGRNVDFKWEESRSFYEKLLTR